ncbi:MAG: discoidin domain-containing protein [Candidatus Brocadiales bacterium]|nr:discoidin domain-containing protein [Candidatus Brocadiales bacterium]
MIFIIIVATGYVLYGMYVYLSAQTGTSTVTLSQATGLGNMLKACEITGWTIVDPVVLKNFGFPSELEIRDIVYMRPVTFQPTLPRFVLALISLFVFAASIRIDRRVWRLLALFFLILASYIFLITTGRILSAPEGYVASQARYFYVPNMFFAIFIVLLVKEKAASFARSSYPLFVSLTCIIILNVFSVRSHTATISEKLLPLTTYIGDVKAFYSEHKQEEDFKLFVDFPISQENGTFNLGADIALDVYFYNAKILTKNIYQAKYVYSKDRTFHKNPLFNLPSPQNPDFTIEFVYTQVVPVPEEFAVIGRLDGEWCFKFTPKNRAVFQAKMFKKKRAFFKVFDTGVILPIDYPVHFVVQKQESILYILVDGEIFCLEDIKGYKLDIDKGISYIMGTPYYGEKLFALPGRLFASIGKPHYDLRGKKLGDICPEVPVLERKANLNIDPEEKKKRELLNRPHWVMVDFGQEPKVVNTVKARPRTANASQFWKVATLKGSNDGVTFKDIADLNVPHVPPENEWLIWTFKNDCPYRFYMILISSGHKDGRFFSCSELKFVAHTQNLIGVPEYTSSPYLGGWSPANLTDENIDTFWHATYYTQHVTANKED